MFTSCIFLRPYVSRALYFQRGMFIRSYSQPVFQGTYFSRDLQYVPSDPCSHHNMLRFEDPMFLRLYISRALGF